MNDFLAGIKFATTALTAWRTAKAQTETYDYMDRWGKLYEQIGSDPTNTILVVRRKPDQLLEGSRRHYLATRDKWQEIAKSDFQPTFPTENDFERGIAFVTEHFEVGNFVLTGELSSVIGNSTRIDRDDPTSRTYEDMRRSYHNGLIAAYKWTNPEYL